MMLRPFLLSVVAYAGSCSVAFAINIAASNQQVTRSYIKQFGSPGIDTSLAIAMGDNHLVIGGVTDPNAAFGSFELDGYVARLDLSANIIWDHTLRSDRRDEVFGVATNNQGEIFVTGATDGNLDGTPSQFRQTVGFLAKFDAAGNQSWLERFDSLTSKSHSITLDPAGNIYVAGETVREFDGMPTEGQADFFLSKFDMNGTKLWSRLYGDVGVDSAWAVTIDEMGNVFVGGRSERVVGGRPIHSERSQLYKVDSDGNEIWSHISSPHLFDSRIMSVATDGSGGAYFSSLGTGFRDDDTYLTRVSAEGKHIWTRDLISEDRDDRVTTIVPDGIGGVFIGGYTYGDLFSEPLGVRAGLFVAQYNRDGDLLWSDKFGMGDNGGLEGLSYDGQGGLYATGWVVGELPGSESSGWSDFFVAKYEIVPEPSTLYLAGLGLLALAGWRRRTRRWDCASCALSVLSEATHGEDYPA